MNGKCVRQPSETRCPPANKQLGSRVEEWVEEWSEIGQKQSKTIGSVEFMETHKYLIIMEIRK
jgi:hypothetical protein